MNTRQLFYRTQCLPISALSLFLMSPCFEAPLRADQVALENVPITRQGATGTCFAHTAATILNQSLGYRATQSGNTIDNQGFVHPIELALLYRPTVLGLFAGTSNDDEENLDGGYVEDLVRMSSQHRFCSFSDFELSMKTLLLSVTPKWVPNDLIDSYLTQNDENDFIDWLEKVNRRFGSKISHFVSDLEVTSFFSRTKTNEEKLELTADFLKRIEASRSFPHEFSLSQLADRAKVFARPTLALMLEDLLKLNSCRTLKMPTLSPMRESSRYFTHQEIIASMKNELRKPNQSVLAMHICAAVLQKGPAERVEKTLLGRMVKSGVTCGHHAVSVIDFRTNGAGEVEFLVQNSWKSPASSYHLSWQYDVDEDKQQLWINAQSLAENTISFSVLPF